MSASWDSGVSRRAHPAWDRVAEARDAAAQARPLAARLWLPQDCLSAGAFLLLVTGIGVAAGPMASSVTDGYVIRS